MVMTTSLDLPLGAAAPDFSLPDVRSGRLVSLSDCKQAGCKGFWCCLSAIIAPM